MSDDFPKPEVLDAAKISTVLQKSAQKQVAISSHKYKQG